MGEWKRTRSDALYPPEAVEPEATEAQLRAQVVELRLELAQYRERARSVARRELVRLRTNQPGHDVVFAARGSSVELVLDFQLNGTSSEVPLDMRQLLELSAALGLLISWKVGKGALGSEAQREFSAVALAGALCDGLTVEELQELAGEITKLWRKRSQEQFIGKGESR